MTYDGLFPADNPLLLFPGTTYEVVLPMHDHYLNLLNGYGVMDGRQSTYNPAETIVATELISQVSNFWSHLATY